MISLPICLKAILRKKIITPFHRVSMVDITVPQIVLIAFSKALKVYSSLVLKRLNRVIIASTKLRKGLQLRTQILLLYFCPVVVKLLNMPTFQKATKDKSKMFGDTKTYNSRRTIKITQSFANDLLFHNSIRNIRIKISLDLKMRTTII